jgi:hypothetical protein
VSHGDLELFCACTKKTQQRTVRSCASPMSACDLDPSPRATTNQRSRCLLWIRKKIINKTVNGYFDMAATEVLLDEIEIIEIFRQFECFYNYRLKEYRDRNAVRVRWEEFSKKIGLSVGEFVLPHF